MANMNFGMSALMEAINCTDSAIKESEKDFDLMEEAADEDVKSILLSSEKAAEMDKQKLDSFIDSIPETKSTDDDFTADEKLQHTMESLKLLTEEMEECGYYE